MKPKLLFKKDQYRSARGGYSRLLNLHCRKCDHVFAVYQKDGPGNLRRLYLDRILQPKEMLGLQKKKIDSIKPLKCKCGFLIGIPGTYPKEKRKVFMVFQDAIVKKIKKLND